VTFTEIVTEVLDRLNLTSAASTARIGRAVNRIYREVGTAIGMSFMRHTNTTKTVSIGNPEVTFTATEKVLQVWTVDGDDNPTILEEVLLAELRERVAPSSDEPRRWALARTASNTVTIRLDAAPATAYSLYADVIAEVSDLSGSNEPSFSESFHDILVEGVLKDEYLKLEKPQLAKLAETTYQRRLSDLRMFVAKSNYQLIRQGEHARAFDQTRLSGGSGGSASFPATSITITGAWTFDRDPLAPFSVTSGSAVVTNLDADKLDGYDESAFAKLADSETITGNWTFNESIIVGTATNGARDVLVSNTSTGSAALARLRLGNVNDSSAGQVALYGSNWTTSGPAVQDGMQVSTSRAGGLSIGATHASGIIRFYTGGTTERMRLATDGTLSLPYGRLEFPATQNPSANANTLDDYEEGTWSPTITGVSGLSGQTYTARNGDYVKIGTWVFVSGTIVLSALGTLTGNAAIGGLPFVFAAGDGAPIMGYWSGLSSSLVRMSAVFESGSTRALLYGATAASTSTTALVQADFSNTTDIRFSFFYRTTA
jgi:hypothetical protein